MKKIASAVAAVCLTAMAGVAAPLLSAGPASAASGSENASAGTAACSHAWLYSQQNYGGTQFFHDCNLKEIQAYPTAVNSVIYNGGGSSAASVGTESRSTPSGTVPTATSGRLSRTVTH